MDERVERIKLESYDFIRLDVGPCTKKVGRKINRFHDFSPEKWTAKIFWVFQPEIVKCVLDFTALKNYSVISSHKNNFFSGKTSKKQS